MGIWNGLFGGGTDRKETVGFPWKALDDVDILPDLAKRSYTVPQVIFKHSYSCGISGMVLNMFSRNFREATGEYEFYLLDLIRHRKVSNAVTQHFGIRHESPQLLIVKNGVVATHASHGAISDVLPV